MILLKNPLGFLFSREENDEHISNREIVSYAIGASGQAITGGFISGRINFFYENHVVTGEKSHYVGKIMTLSIIWDAINDILVGGFVDRRAHKPYQKMKPYLTVVPPLIGGLSIATFLAGFENDIFNLIFLIATYFFWDLLYSFEEVGIWGMLALSSPHSHERARVTQWVSIGAGLGGYIPKLFPTFWDLLKNVGMRERYIFIMFAFIFGIGGQLMARRAAKFHERIDAPVQKDESFIKSLTVLKHNPTLILVGLAKTIHEIYPRIDRTYFYRSQFNNNPKFKGGTAETLYDTLSSIPGACSVFFANKLINKFGGMKRYLLISQLAIIGARIVAYFVGIIPNWEFSTFRGFLIMCIIIGVSSGFTSFMDIAHRSLINDSIDEVELKTGLRTEGISSSMLSFFNKITSSITALIKNFTLYSFLGYQALTDNADYNVAHQSAKFYKWQYPIFMLAPIIGEALYMIVIAFVNDNKERKADIERQLAERRAGLSEKIDEMV